MALVKRGDFIARIDKNSGYIFMQLENGSSIIVADTHHISNKDEKGNYKASYKAIYLDEDGNWNFLGEPNRPKKHRIFSSREEATNAVLDFLTN